jgi:hypothetical protein
MNAILGRISGIAGSGTAEHSRRPHWSGRARPGLSELARRPTRGGWEHFHYLAVLANMTHDVLFTAGDLAITSKVARFGHTAYQVASISGVAVENTRRMNTLALLLIFLALAFSLPALSLRSFLEAAFVQKQASGSTPWVWRSALPGPSFN